VIAVELEFADLSGNVPDRESSVRQRVTPRLATHAHLEHPLRAERQAIGAGHHFAPKRRERPSSCCFRVRPLRISEVNDGFVKLFVLGSKTPHLFSEELVHAELPGPVLLRDIASLASPLSQESLPVVRILLAPGVGDADAIRYVGVDPRLHPTMDVEAIVAVDLVETLIERFFCELELASQLIDSAENDDLVRGGRRSGRLTGVVLAADGNAAKRSRPQ
jgi:hypothetical protein